jgi:hypothetical protein
MRFAQTFVGKKQETKGIRIYVGVDGRIILNKL